MNTLADFRIENGVLYKYIGMEEHVVIPDGVTDIEKNAFGGCENLQKIYIGKSVKRLGFDVFAGCFSLKEVEIDPENQEYSVREGLILTKNGKKVIMVLPSLTGIYQVPDGVEEIGYFAFSECKKLQGIRFSPSVVRIDLEAFANCDELVSVVIPETVKEISFGAFAKSDWRSNSKPFEELVVSPKAGSIQASGSFYLGAGDDPVCYPQFPISFATNTEDKRRLALGYCLNSEKYTEDYEKDYLKYVKSQKRYLLEIAKKKNINEVEAFYETLEAKQPKKNTKKTVGEEQNVAPQELQANAQEEFELAGETLVKYVGSSTQVVIPDSVKNISANAFTGCAGVKNIVVPGSVESISQHVFYDCKKLECVTFLAGVKTIEKKAFVKCPKLKTVILYSTEMELEFNFYKFRESLEVLAPNMSPAVFPTTNRQQSVVSLAKAIAEKKIVKPDGKGKFASYLKRANYQYFALAEKDDALFDLMLDLGALTAKEAPELLELWKEQSTERKIRLMELSEQKNSKKTEGMDVFEEGFSAKPLTVAELKKEWTYTTIVLDKSVTGTESIKGIEIRKYKGFKTEVEVPAYIGKQPVICIGAVAFNNNKNITKVIIPETIQRIDDRAFERCTKLESVEHYGKELKLASYVFYGCSSLAYFHTTATKFSHAIHSFAGTKLFDKDGFLILDVGAERVLCDYKLPIEQAELTIPDGVTIIGKYTFGESNNFNQSSNKKLRKVNIPASVKHIGASAFSKAQSLQSVILQEGLISIEAMAFFECTSLRKIYIPSSVKTIEGGAFYRCNNLTIYGKLGTAAQVYAEKNKHRFVADNGKEQQEELVDFIVDDGILKKYLGNETNVVIPEQIHIIDAFACHENNVIQRLEIGNQVKTIGKYAFSNCNHLSDVKICGNVKHIEECAFQFSSASYVEIEEGVEEIGEQAFGYLSALGAEIIVPESVIQIGKDAFYSNFEKTKLRVKKGSYAETYAIENKISFEVE